jgi:hypothetical protein
MTNDVVADRFFHEFEPVKDAYATARLAYVANTTDRGSEIIAAELLFFARSIPLDREPFTSSGIAANHIRLSDVGISAEQAVRRLLSGTLEIDGHRLKMPGSSSLHQAYHLPFDEEGLSRQMRYNVLRLTAPPWARPEHQQWTDWELRAGAVPFDGLQELLTTYIVRPISSPLQSRFEAIALPLIELDFTSKVDGSVATSKVRMARSLQIDEVRLGYRVVKDRSTVSRGVLQGKDMTWAALDGVDDIMLGTSEITVPEGAAVQLLASYRNRLQHYWWIADPALSSNGRCAIYQTYDPNFTKLKEMISRPYGKGRDARDFETAIAWIGWIRGFSVAQLGLIPQTQQAPDLIFTTETGRVVVVECTTGHLKSDHKLSLLVQRTTEIKRRMEVSGKGYLGVIPAIVTALTAEEVAADIEQAERLGVLVVTKEDLDGAIQILSINPNSADQQFQQSQDQIAARMAKHVAPAEGENGKPSGTGG